MRRIVEFEADLPDDQVEADGEIVVFGGRGATQSLRQAMIDQGWATEEVDQHSDNVWFFNMRGKLGSATAYLSDMRPKYVVTFERHAWFEDFFGLSRSSFREALASLESALLALGGRNLTWFKTYDAADRPYPTIDEVMRA